MEPRKKVLDYYLRHLSELSIADQFHFAIRTTAWLDLDESRAHLRALRPHILPRIDTHEGYAEAFRDKVQSKPHDAINAFSARAPYFEKYPLLYGTELALFYLHWLQGVYEIDASKALLETVSLETLQEIDTQLQQDPGALKTLSTYAVNFIYLLHFDVLKDTNIPRQLFFDLGSRYDTNDPEQLQLLLYLYTHCILCETHFYTKTIATEHLALYQKMLAVLEAEIEAYYDQVHLDGKVEFLVCAQICNYTTSLRDRIDAECEQSVSEDGTFIIDKLNTRPQKHRRTFKTSEHRNVLYIMSGSSFDPHSIAVA